MRVSTGLLTATLALSGLLVATQAQAVSETFLFTQSTNWTTGTLTFTSQSGNETVRVNAAGSSNEIGVSGGNGLTVCSSGNPSGPANGRNCEQVGEQHYIDNADPGAGNEFVRFVFEQEVSLLSLTASFVDSNDDFALRVGGTNRGNNHDFNNFGGFNLASLGGDLTDNIFRIGAFGTDNNDNFKLRSLTVDFQDAPPPPPPPAAVPEPSTILLLGSGLAGLGLWRMKKGQKS